MPVIREYSPQVAANYRPLDQPANPGFAEHAGDAGKAMGQAISQLGQTAFNIAEQNDATNAQVQLAQARADFTAKMQRARETGEAADPEYVQSVQNAAQDQAAQIADKMQTRAGANMARAYGANFAAGMQTMAIHDNAAAIGEQAKQSAMETQNINRNTLRSSPEQFQAILGETMNLLDGPQYAHVDARVRDEMKIQAKQGLALSAIEGVIHTRSPEEAKQILDSGKMDGFLDADGKRTLYAEADQAIRAREVDTERVRRLQKQQQQDAADKTMDGMMQKIYSPQGNTLTRAEIMADPTLTYRDRWTMIQMSNRANVLNNKSDPATANDLFQRIHLPDGDPNKITNANQIRDFVGAENGISINDYTRLSKMIGDERDPANQSLNSLRAKLFKGVKSQITKSSFMGADPEGDKQYLLFQNWAAEREQQARDNKESVMDLYNPQSKNYIGSPEVLRMFQRTPQEIVNDMANKIRSQQPSHIEWPGKQTAVTPRIDGETPQQYIERIRGGK